MCIIFWPAVLSWGCSAHLMSLTHPLHPSRAACHAGPRRAGAGARGVRRDGRGPLCYGAALRERECTGVCVCGRSFASQDAQMFGLRTRERAQTRGGDMSSLGGRAEFLAADFFSMTAAVPYDFIFDYTFLCAIPPSTRTLWAGVRVACARSRAHYSLPRAVCGVGSFVGRPRDRCDGATAAPQWRARDANIPRRS